MVRVTSLVVAIQVTAVALKSKSVGGSKAGTITSIGVIIIHPFASFTQAVTVPAVNVE